MNYSATLPPGFKTWNDLWNNVKDKVVADTHVSYYEKSGNELMYRRDYEVKEIKLRSFDEIIEFINNSDFNDPNMLAKLEQLTHTKLFK